MVQLFIFLLMPGMYHSTASKADRSFEISKAYTTDCDSIPDLNRQIVAFVSTKIKKKVGRGECWDLAAEALETVDATWDKKYKFGERIDYKTDCVFPGDILQFENVKLKMTEGNQMGVGDIKHHTAIVYEVLGKGIYMLAHQNTSFSGKKVGLSELDMTTVTRGRITFYRPTR